MKKIIPILALAMLLCGFEKESPNKQTVLRYIAGFNAGDHQKILNCLSEDVIWEMPVCMPILAKLLLTKKLKTKVLPEDHRLRSCDWLKKKTLWLQKVA